MALTSPASANPRPLPFTYPYGTLPAGTLEIEQYLDFSPVRVELVEAGGTRAVTDHRYELQTELEYGITDRLEAGFYFVLRQPGSASPALRFEGIKQRLHYRLAEAGQWPVDVGLYGEIAEFHDELELEEKVLLSRRFGRVQVMANLWVEQEYELHGKEWELIYNPTVGVTAELSPNFMVGLEYWVRGVLELEEEEAGAAEPPVLHYAGPTFMAQRGEYFLSMGAYARLDNLGDSTIVGDQYGRLWVRVVVGIGL